MILQHHERQDGSGYPAGLEGEAILPDARLLAVADVVEAMASHRPYRPAHGIEAALAEIHEGAGMRYDDAVVAACEQVFAAGSGSRRLDATRERLRGLRVRPPARASVSLRRTPHRRRYAWRRRAPRRRDAAGRRGDRRCARRRPRRWP